MKSIHTPEYRRLLARLQAARKAAGLTQAQVAERFGRPQSFVSTFASLYGKPFTSFLDLKCESGEHRLDPTELATAAWGEDRSGRATVGDLTTHNLPPFRACQRVGPAARAAVSEAALPR